MTGETKSSGTELEDGPKIKRCKIDGGEVKTASKASQKGDTKTQESFGKQDDGSIIVQTNLIASPQQLSRLVEKEQYDRSFPKKGNNRRRRNGKTKRR